MLRHELATLFQHNGACDDSWLEMLDHVPTPLAFVSNDEAYRVIYVNLAFTNLFGYQKDDIKSVAGWTELVYEDSQFSQQRLSGWQAAVQQARKEQRPIPDRESHVRRKDGSYRDVIIQTSQLRHLILLAFTDITERNQLADDVARREKRFRSFVENANDIIYTIDLQGHFTYASPNIQTVLGLCPDTLVGTDFRTLIHPQDLDACLHAFATVTQQGQKLTGLEYRVRKGDGHWSWQSSNLGPIVDDDGHITALVGVGRDIHQRKHIEEQLHLSETRYRLLSDYARDVIWTIAPDGKITYVSPSVALVRGYTPEEAMQQPLEQILTPDSMALNRAYFGELMADLAAGRPPKPFRGQLEYLCKDGSTYWCEVMATPILSEDGSLLELLGVSRDISEHKRYEAELKKAKEATEQLNRALEDANQRLNLLATTDALTGLWNRRQFDARVQHEMSLVKRYGHPLSVLIFDIDHFKQVNDTFGHLCGDQVLIELAQRTRQQVRATDSPFRWGGEEFLILMPQTKSGDALAVAEKLRASFESQPVSGIGVITASFGVATYLAGESLDHWIARVDSALYAAKDAGRNTVKLAQ